jgi:peptidoglycan/xylan/chitin deacetylase (PgdA/CDA1 family)
MSLFTRIRSRWQREASRRLCRRPWMMQNREPLISFTFDDFPASALYTAGEILKEHGIAGTYYTSFGLMGTIAPTGQIFAADDIPRLLASGHELGCHTYHHRHSYDTPPEQFEASIAANQAAFEKLAPGQQFQSLSYPISGPRPATKRRCARHFAGSRAGGQVGNEGEVDLDALSAFFLEQSREDFAAVERVIARTAAANGWLILATHDVAPDPTPYGVTPEFFRKVVRAAVASGAKLVPVSQGLREIGVK